MKVSDFNRMTLKELVALQGIGRQTAKRIIARREKYVFQSVKDLLSVKGLGAVTLTRLGLKIPKKKSKAKEVRELIKFVSDYKVNFHKKSFNDYSNNKKVSFYKDCVKSTCHRPDLVKSKNGCNSCPFVLICECKLRNFVSENNKRRNTPTKKIVNYILDNIQYYKHFQHSDGSVNKEMINLPEEFLND